METRKNQDAENVSRARRKVFAASEVVRRMVFTLDAARALRSDLRRLAAVANDTNLPHLWQQAGLPPQTEEEEDTDGMTHLVDELPTDAHGCLWVVEHLIDVIESHLPAGVRGGQDDDGEDEEDSPAVVVEGPAHG
jgi:hypothetical protein